MANYAPRIQTAHYRAPLRSVDTIADLDLDAAGVSLSFEDHQDDNEIRAGWALDAVMIFAERVGTTNEHPETVLGDLLGNLRHLCDVTGVDFDVVNDNGKEHYEDEINGVV